MECISFQIINVDYQLIDFINPIIRIFGRTEEGKSICCCIDNFEPYFYAELKDNIFDEEKVKIKIKTLYPQVKKIETIYKYKPIGYQKNKTKMLKISTYSPGNVRDIRDIILKNESNYISQIYESDILFRNRFLVDNDINGFQWAYINKENIIENSIIFKKIDIQCDIRYHINKINK